MSFLKNIFDRIGICEKLRLWRVEERKEPEAVEDVLKKIKGRKIWANTGGCFEVEGKDF